MNNSVFFFLLLCDKKTNVFGHEKRLNGILKKAWINSSAASQISLT